MRCIAQTEDLGLSRPRRIYCSFHCVLEMRISSRQEVETGLWVWERTYF